MLFNSYLFIFGFLPLSIFLYALADPHPKLRMPALIGLSFAFYSYWNPIYLALLLPSILVNWLVSLLYQETKRAFILTGAIAANLLVLGLFKYENFFAQALASVTGLPVPRFRHPFAARDQFLHVPSHHVSGRLAARDRAGFFARPLRAVHLFFSAGAFRPPGALV